MNLKIVGIISFWRISLILYVYYLLLKMKNISIIWLDCNGKSERIDKVVFDVILYEIYLWVIDFSKL